MTTLDMDAVEQAHRLLQRAADAVGQLIEDHPRYTFTFPSMRRDVELSEASEETFRHAVRLLELAHSACREAGLRPTKRGSAIEVDVFVPTGVTTPEEITQALYRRTRGGAA
ncbi:hypothetical protein [Streptomyces sp. N35]|uniref:hypothetical protein n=1 Tax=Streptomyces sp. N35 TaxID=2795730 RepID=UPI0018F31545|nr:hypothetical protein [Streptomyces sp. N35]